MSLWGATRERPVRRRLFAPVSFPEALGAKGLLPPQGSWGLQPGTTDCCSGEPKRPSCESQGQTAAENERVVDAGRERLERQLIALAHSAGGIASCQKAQSFKH